VFSAAGVVCSTPPSQDSAKLLSQLKPLRTLTPHALSRFSFFVVGLLGGGGLISYYFVFRFVGYGIFCILVRFVGFKVLTVVTLEDFGLLVLYFDFIGISRNVVYFTHN
jgi:hypothetical protein